MSLRQEPRSGRRGLCLDGKPHKIVLPEGVDWPAPDGTELQCVKCEQIMLWDAPTEKMPNGFLWAPDEEELALARLER